MEISRSWAAGARLRAAKANLLDLAQPIIPDQRLQGYFDQRSALNISCRQLAERDRLTERRA
jgi:hypothetical protein